MSHSSPPLNRELIRRLPKVVLHEHLDGSVRPSTLIELAERAGYSDLPATSPEALADWFFAGADRGSLPLYLEGFQHTVALLQDEQALERAAYEYLEDSAADGVVYSEVRFAPLLHTSGGLGLDAVMTAVLRGLHRAAEDHQVGFGLIVCALRNQPEELSYRLAELAIAYRNQGVVGFDLAGEEAGHPAVDHLRAFQLVQRQNFNITVHAGESFGPESIWQALQYCGAHRIGHGTRLVEDLAVHEGRVIKVGTLAEYVIDHRIPLEICLSSNVHTGATSSIDAHPFPLFAQLGMRLTLNTDNRLMSRTTMTDEYLLAVEHFQADLDLLETLSINAMKSAFAHYAERRRFIYERIKEPTRQLRNELGLPPRVVYEERR